MSLNDEQIAQLANALSVGNMKRLLPLWTAIHGGSLSIEDALELNKQATEFLIKAYGFKIKELKHHACDAEYAIAVYGGNGKLDKKHKEAAKFIKRFWEKGFLNWETFLKKYGEKQED